MPSARRVKWAKFRIAAVAVSACAILVALLYLLIGGTLLRERAVLFLFLPDATGLGPGSPVRVDGIGVGKVTSVALSGSSQPARVVKVILSVEQDHLSEIPVDSVAQISADNMIGDDFVDVTSGKSDRHIRPGGEIAYQTQQELLKTLDLSQFESQLRSLDDMLSDIEAGRGLVGQFVMGEQLYDELMQQVGETERGVRAAASTATPLGQAFYTDSLYRKITGPLADLDKALAGLQSGQGAGGQLLRDPAGYESFRQAAVALRHSIAGWRGGELVASDRLYAEWNGRIASFIHAIDQFDAGPALSSSQPYDSLNAAASQLRDGLREFRSDPQKFLRVKVF
jgi:phospholipid/cholesterol/gamma-HCH transport system substrate-binding protein